MGLPSVNITFQSLAATAIQRGAVGILAMVLKDSSVTEVTEYVMNSITDVNASLSSDNKAYIQQAFMGTPKSIKAVVIPDTAGDYSTALTYLETIKWNIVVIPGILSGDTNTIATWAQGMRDTKGRKIQVVLPHEAADHEAVINFCVEDAAGTAGNVTVDGESKSANAYAARIAGLIAGLPLTVAPTYRVLSEISDVPHLTKSEADTKVDAGKLILYHDGEKVKIARGVTSLTTTSEAKGSDWKKIKLVRILDMVYQDIKDTIEDHYIGSVQNSYANKLLLCAAINAYFEQLEMDGILDPGQNRCEIDVQAQKVYLQSKGIDVTGLSDQEIKETNTDDQVFLLSSVRPLDAIEDISLKINL